MGWLIVLVALFGLFWLLVLRPQRRRQMEQLQMQDSLRLGDEVITAGGIRGYVRRLDEDVLGIEIAPDVDVRVDRRAIAGVVREEGDEALEDEPEPAAQAETPES